MSSILNSSQFGSLMSSLSLPNSGDMGVGAFIPPIGVGFYVSAAVAGSDIEAAARTMVPYAVVLVLAVLLIAFVPDITMIVPRLLGAH